MDHYNNFIFVIISQLFFLIAKAFYFRIDIKETSKIILIGMVAGIFMGFGFDIIIGKSMGIYSYTHGWDTVFLFFNGLLSFGITISSTIIYTYRFDLKKKHIPFFKNFLFLLISIFSIFILKIVVISTILKKMFLSGIVIITLFDSLLTISNQSIILKFHNRESLIILIKLYFFSVLIGLWYEVTNYFFPLWSWNIIKELSLLETEIFIIFLGYFVLIFPMFIISHFTKKFFLNIHNS